MNGIDVRSRDQAIQLFSEKGSEIKLLLARPQLQVNSVTFVQLQVNSVTFVQLEVNSVTFVTIVQLQVNSVTFYSLYNYR